jgi:hypothetical protein
MKPLSFTYIVTMSPLLFTKGASSSSARTTVIRRMRTTTTEQVYKSSKAADSKSSSKDRSLLTNEEGAISFSFSLHMPPILPPDIISNNPFDTIPDTTTTTTTDNESPFSITNDGVPSLIDGSMSIMDTTEISAESDTTPDDNPFDVDLSTRVPLSTIPTLSPMEDDNNNILTPSPSVDPFSGLWDLDIPGAFSMSMSLSMMSMSVGYFDHSEGLPDFPFFDFSMPMMSMSMDDIVSMACPSSCTTSFCECTYMEEVEADCIPQIVNECTITQPKSQCLVDLFDNGVGESSDIFCNSAVCLGEGKSELECRCQFVAETCQSDASAEWACVESMCCDDADNDEDRGVCFAMEEEGGWNTIIGLSLSMSFSMSVSLTETTVTTVVPSPSFGGLTMIPTRYVFLLLSIVVIHLTPTDQRNEPNMPTQRQKNGIK